MLTSLSISISFSSEINVWAITSSFYNSICVSKQLLWNIFKWFFCSLFFFFFFLNRCHSYICILKLAFIFSLASIHWNLNSHKQQSIVCSAICRSTKERTKHFKANGWKNPMVVKKKKNLCRRRKKKNPHSHTTFVQCSKQLNHVIYVTVPLSTSSSAEKK